MKTDQNAQKVKNERLLTDKKQKQLNCKFSAEFASFYSSEQTNRTNTFFLSPFIEPFDATASTSSATRRSL